MKDTKTATRPETRVPGQSTTSSERRKNEGDMPPARRRWAWGEGVPVRSMEYGVQYVVCTECNAHTRLVKITGAIVKWTILPITCWDLPDEILSF